MHGRDRIPIFCKDFFSHHKMVDISQSMDTKYIVKASKSNICLLFTILVDHCNATDVNFLTVIIFDLIFLFLYHNRAETKIVSL